MLALPFVGGGTAAHAGEFHADIFAIDLSGRQTNLTQSASLNAAPAAANDGRIAFLSDRDGTIDIYVMNGDGRDVRRLTTGAPLEGGAEDLENSRLAWSPQNDRVAFDGAYGPVEPNCLQHCDGWAVSVVGSDGSGLRQIATNARAPAWSPDGRSLAFQSDVGAVDYDDSASVTIARLDGSGSTRVNALNGGGARPGPVWSAQANELAFQAEPRSESPMSVNVMRADGTARRRLATGHDPSWSPDGRRLAFVYEHRLVTIGRDGRARKRISPQGTQVVTAVWSPKGWTIAYLDGTALETVRADGTHARVLARKPNDVLIWGPPVWTRDGKRILLAV